MARIRTIKPVFFRHAGLFDAEQDAGLPLRVAFAGLWTAADREGRFEWKPRELKLDCLPHDAVDFSRVLDALATRGFIRKYTVHGVTYGCIPSWQDHQVINNRESASEIPGPPEVTEDQSELTRAPRVGDASVTPLVHAQEEGEGKGKGRGKEGKGVDRSAASAPDLQPAVDAWNELAVGCGLSRVQVLTEPRKRSLARRLEECGGMEGWRVALDKVRNNSFLRGQNRQGWKANFDFLLQQSSFTKLMEDGYQSGTPSGGDGFAQLMRERMHESAHDHD